MHSPVRLLKLVVLALMLIPMVARSADPDVPAQELPPVPATEPADALATFRVQPGFHLELAAAEPLVVDPVAMSFDENGRLYVVEMRGYSERREEKMGRIKLLEDTDHNGRYDKATVFTDGLAWPTAVTCWDGGVFVGATPDIWYFKDHDGDGVAEEKRVVFTGFARDVSRLNVQAMLNSFQWGPDQRIHGATSFNGGRVTTVGVAGAKTVDLRGRDFSFDPVTLDLRPESGGGQHGMTFDDAGRKFVCSNSRHIMQVMYENHMAARSRFYSMPAPAVDIAVDGPAAEVFRISPDEPWRIVRTRWRIAGLVGGPVEGGGRVSGYFTGASGVTVYRGDAWPAAFHEDAFIGDVGGNLVHHKRLSFAGLVAKAERPANERDHEFLASTDTWFRPVQFSNAPDGCLYIADMYREVIEHPWSLPPSIKQHLDLNSGNDRGRLWRIAPDQFAAPSPPRLGALTIPELVATLEDSNGWHRDTAARLLHERQDASAVEPLTRLLTQSSLAKARWHALQVLAGLGLLNVEHLQRALQDPDEQVRVLAVRFGARRFGRESFFQPDLWSQWFKMSEDASLLVRYQMALSLGDVPDERTLDALGRLIRRDVREPWMQAAVLNSASSAEGKSVVRGGDGALLRALLREEEFVGQDQGLVFLRELAGLVGLKSESSAIESVKAWLVRENHWEPAASVALGLAEGLQKAGRSLAQVDDDRALDPFFERVALQLADVSNPAAARIQALRLLGWRLNEDSRNQIWRQLVTDHSAALPRAAWETLRNHAGDFLANQLLEHWSDLPDFARQEGLSLTLKPDTRTRRMLALVRQGTISTNLFTASLKGQLRDHPNPEIRRAAVDLFGAVQTVEDRLRELQPALELTGRPAAGQVVYRDRCASCHRLGEEGHELGPDLATVKNAGAEKLLSSLLDPNREVAPNYVQYDIETRDGEALSGIIASENTAGLTVRQANGLETVLVRANVAGMRSTGRSPMPEGLTEGLSLQDVADLLAFVLR